MKRLIEFIINFFKKLFKRNENNVIYYTTYDGKIVNIRYTYPKPFGDAIVKSNTYEDGRGVIRFNKPVKTIFPYTFKEAYNLETITLPESLENIEHLVFNNERIKAFYGKFASEDNKSLIVGNKLVAVAFAGINSYVVPDNVENFCHVFKNLKRKDLSITVNKYCGNSDDFYHSYVQLISNAPNVPDWSFANNGFSKVTIGENTKTIGKSAFMRAKGEYYYDIALYIPYSEKCQIICNPTIPPTLGDEYVFGSISPGTDQDWPEDHFIYQSIKVPKNSLFIYKVKWNKYSNYLQLNSSLY